MSDSVSDLPTWAQDLIRNLRDESASARVEKREAVERAIRETTDKLTADHTATVNRLNSELTSLEGKNTELTVKELRLSATLNLGVDGPDALDFADRLRGETAEEIKADAERAKALYRPSDKRTLATDPSQGHGAGSDTENSSVDEEFGNFILGQLDR